MWPWCLELNILRLVPLAFSGGSVKYLYVDHTLAEVSILTCIRRASSMACDGNLSSTHTEKLLGTFLPI